jgi:hypothetical protein
LGLECENLQSDRSKAGKAIVSVDGVWVGNDVGVGVADGFSKGFAVCVGTAVGFVVAVGIEVDVTVGKAIGVAGS